MAKAGRERLTPYQSKDPSPTTTTHKRERREQQKQLKTNWERVAEANKKALLLLLKPASTGSERSLDRDSASGIKVVRYCEVLTRKYTDVQSKHNV